MKRRAVLAGLLAAPATAHAQQGKRLPSVGILFLRSPSELGPSERTVVPALAELGWIDGKTVHIEYRYADGNYDGLSAPAAELVAAQVDVIVTYATGVIAARRATATIPIVQATGGDPVMLGYAASLARPGGNVTGSAFFYAELMAKRLDLLKELDPSLARAGALVNAADYGANEPVRVSLGTAAKAIGVDVEIAPVRGPEEFEPTVAGWASKGIRGVLVSDHNLFVKKANAETLARVAIAHHLPSIGAIEVGRAGALMAYGINFADQFRRAAVFVDRILKGAKPADLPFEQATKFLYLFNLKTAKALGVVIPPALLARADEVIE
jgi:putative tryptophan/tyrosine transport system substrate-binding protein